MQRRGRRLTIRQQHTQRSKCRGVPPTDVVDRHGNHLLVRCIQFNLEFEANCGPCNSTDAPTYYFTLQVQRHYLCTTTILQNKLLQFLFIITNLVSFEFK